MNEYAHIPPPPPPPVSVGHAPVHPPAPYVATSSAPRRRASRGWVAAISTVALGASVLGVVAVTTHDDSRAGSPVAAAVEGTQAQKTARMDITVEAPGLASPLVTTAEVDLDEPAQFVSADADIQVKVGSQQLLVAGQSTPRAPTARLRLEVEDLDVLRSGSLPPQLDVQVGYGQGVADERE